MKMITFSMVLALAAASASVDAWAAPANHYTTADTPVGTLLKDPAAQAVVAKQFPGFVKSPAVLSGQLDDRTLRDLQQFKSDVFTDEALSALDAELAKLPVK